MKTYRTWRSLAVHIRDNHEPCAEAWGLVSLISWDRGLRVCPACTLRAYFAEVGAALAGVALAYTRVLGAEPTFKERRSTLT